MEIFHIAPECFPAAKVGVLADTIGALTKFQCKDKQEIGVIIPAYETNFILNNDFETIFSDFVKLGNFNFPFEILKEKKSTLEFDLYLVKIPELFDRTEIYGYEDDIERFIAFQIAVLNWLNSKERVPDIIHCHEHQTGLIPFMIKHAFKYNQLRNVKTIFTIHNANYQGQFGYDKLYYLPEFDLSKLNLLDWNNSINSLAAGIKSANWITTVSNNYLNELNKNSCGLESLFNSVRNKSIGILNGIDTEVWNPEKDPFIQFNFSQKTLENGKLQNKDALCKQFNLDSRLPLFSFIGKLFDDEGADLLPEVVSRVLNENYKKLNILILGSGNSDIETNLRNQINNFKGNFNFQLEFNTELEHLIYAASDFVLIPAKFSPCGLNQMYSFRYGAIPIVRRTGGLKDTVIDIGDDGNGICHDQASVEDVIYSINRALELFKNEKKFKKVQKKIMKIDHSWKKVCLKYKELYHLTTIKNEI